MSLKPGTRLGPFEVVAPVGAGGMGEVYRARDTNLHRDVALKILPESFAADADRLARFKREAQVLASLNHPNIAAIHGLERSDGATALVMELVEGEDLSGIIARGPMPLEDALPIARQIIDALEAAHEQGIVHRDLKPANVKVRPDGTVKVLDFGLAKAIEPAGAASGNSASISPTITTPAMTEMGMILGTAAYMSPEQAKGRAVDKRADIWAFGAVLYEMLTGQRAFAGEDVSDTLAAVLRVDVNFDALPADAPPRVRRTLAACLQRHLKQRVPDIGAVRLALDGAFETAAPDTPIAVAAVAPRWRRVLPIAVTAVVVSLVAGLIAWTRWPVPVTAPQPLARFSIPLPEGQSFTNTGRHVVAVSPDGANLVYVANQRLYLRPMSGLEAHEIPGSADTSGGVHSPAFSPDGQSVAFYQGGDQALKTLPIVGGTPQKVCETPRVVSLSWNGSDLVYTVDGPGKPIWRVPATGGAPAVLVEAGADEEVGMAQLLPGGRAVLFSARAPGTPYDEGTIAVQPLDGGARKTLVQGGWDGRYLPTGHVVYAVEGVLRAVPFDLGSLSVTGESVSLVEGVRRTGVTGAAQFSYSSATGALAFLPGPARTGSSSDARDLVIVDRQGVATPLGLPPGPYRSPRVSPDGRFVTFDTDGGREADVWIYALDGESRIRQLTFGGRNQYPIWSDDGQFVVFQSDREGDRGIFRQRADGASSPERLTTAEAGAEHVPQAFSPDGAHLLYSVRQGGEWTLWTRATTEQTSTMFGDIHSEFLVEAAFSPDGRWVAYQERNSSQSAGTFLQPFPAVPGVKYSVSPGGHPYWSPEGDELIVNMDIRRSGIFPITTTPAVTVGAPIDFPHEYGGVKGSPWTTRRNVDSLPDGTHIIGVSKVATADTVAIDDASRITVVLNWFEDVKQRVR